MVKLLMHKDVVVAGLKKNADDGRWDIAEIYCRGHMPVGAADSCGFNHWLETRNIGFKDFIVV